MDASRAQLWYIIAMQSVCVFCGSSPGRNPRYVEAAASLAAAMTRRRIALVYGGASVGVMGALANAALEAGGEVTGVIPKHLMDRELFHQNLTALHVVESMHERKALMGSLSDAFIALPGGLGTLEEFFEVMTWNQLGIHRKPCGLLNVDSFFDGLTGFLDHAVQEEFVPRAHRSFLMVERDPDALLDGLREWTMHRATGRE